MDSKKEKIDNGPQTEYSISGTPADCVKFAVREILERKPDLCVSGINHGANSSINVIYSGTMSAAIEAGIEGIKSIGFSLLGKLLILTFFPTASIFPSSLIIKPPFSLIELCGSIIFAFIKNCFFIMYKIFLDKPFLQLHQVQLVL